MPSDTFLVCDAKYDDVFACQLKEIHEVILQDRFEVEVNLICRSAIIAQAVPDEHLPIQFAQSFNFQSGNPLR